MYLMWKALCFRRQHVDLFQQAEMVPLRSAGCYADHVAAFMRRTPNASVLVVVPRWLSTVRSKPEGEPFNFDWCDTRVLLPPDSPQQWKNILSPVELSVSLSGGEPSVMAQDLFQDFPVAFLQSS
jgi:(1->4)-alpha-D-glucan 1-alpha-D-glucosylmutase